MKGTVLVGTLIVAAAVGFAAGWYLHQPKSPELVAAAQPKKATTVKVVITMKADNSCAQLNSQGGFAKVPPLSRSNGDSITWLKGIDAKGHDAPLVVTFPQMSNTHTGSPFDPKFIFHGGDNSGPPAKNAPDDAYLYLSVTVGGVPCTNPQDPGVIIDRIKFRNMFRLPEGQQAALNSHQGARETPGFGASGRSLECHASCCERNARPLLSSTNPVFAVDRRTGCKPALPGTGHRDRRGLARSALSKFVAAADLSPSMAL